MVRVTNEELKHELDEAKAQLELAHDELGRLRGQNIALMQEREFIATAHKKTLLWKLSKPFRFLLKMFYLLFKDMKEPKNE